MPSLSISIIIPAHHEPDLFVTLRDVERAQEAAAMPLKVYVVLNESEMDDDSIHTFHLQQFDRMKSQNFTFHLEPIHLSHVPNKKAGVGHARKTGMDWAVEKGSADRSHILVCLDADCRVRKDYLKGWSQIYAHEEIDAAVMQFEHLTDSGSTMLDQAIIEYETHLRYYHHLQFLSGYPHAMQPIGSCLSVRADFYQKIGGMNRRKAGEDFYFLQKCQLNGKVAHASNSRIYPSNRISDRVPFGTGRAMMERLENSPQLTYDFACLPMLKKVVSVLSQTHLDSEALWHHLPIQSHFFFENERLLDHWVETARHTRTAQAFYDRIFRWFHPFRFMKLTHHLRDTAFPAVPIQHALKSYFESRNQNYPDTMSEALDTLRLWGEHDRLWKEW